MDVDVELQVGGLPVRHPDALGTPRRGPAHPPHLAEHGVIRRAVAAALGIHLDDSLCLGPVGRPKFDPQVRHATDGTTAGRGLGSEFGGASRRVAAVVSGAVDEQPCAHHVNGRANLAVTAGVRLTQAFYFSKSAYFIWYCTPGPPATGSCCR